MPSIHRANLIQIIESEIQDCLDKVQFEHQAFVRLAANWLGFSELDEDKHFIDGAGDRGVDFWYSTDSGFEIFQVKSHELDASGRLDLSNFDNEGVQDLSRIFDLLIDEKTDLGGSEKLISFRKEWEYAITTKRLAESTEEPYLVNLGLVLFGKGLTSGAQHEFSSFMNRISKPIVYRDIPIEFRAKVYNIDEILLARWREDNREWVDKEGKKREHIDIRPEAEEEGIGWVKSRHSVVFYCRAIDLIKAFGDFGYQMFEPNVRAHIRKSKVNTAIRKSLAHKASRKEFKFLNNGVTIICKTYRNPSSNRPYFYVTEPGVVNGLQTVVALYEAYHNDLDAAGKNDLEENCHVLVRLLRTEAVRDVNNVVLASNTQNPMQARNLKSNTTEQIYYERLFAHQLGWFYERKQGAWDAFKDDPSRWRTLSNKRAKDFQVSNGGRKFRKVDNEQLAQTWLSFIGFSNEAVHNKRYLFEDDNWYNLVFLHRIPQHAAEFGFRDSIARDIWIDDAPAPNLMLVSFLARQFAKEVSLSSRENREFTCTRLSIDQNLTPKEELSVKLAQDDEYLLEQVIAAMSYVFVEFLGYVLYKSLEKDVHNIGPQLLNNGSLKFLASSNDFDPVRKKVRSNDIEHDDLLPIVWFAFRHTIEQLMAGPWKQSYQTARNRTRFNHSVDTRSKIYKQVDELDKFMSKTQLAQVWAAGIPAKTGFYKYIQAVL